MRCVLLLCLVWLGGCTYVGTTTPITDPSVPADQKLIGSWANADHGLFNVIEDKESNKLYVIGVGPGSTKDYCLVAELRTLQLTDYGFLELSVQDGIYECLPPHERNKLTDMFEMPEDSGLTYVLVPYRLAKLNDPEVAKFKDKNNESIQKLIDYYEVTDENPDVFQFGYFADSSELLEHVQAGHLKGVINDCKYGTCVDISDTAEAIETYFLGHQSDSSIFGWENEFLLIRIKSPESSAEQ